MDTKWKRYKYSRFNKFLCAFVACIMVVIAFTDVSVLFSKVSYDETNATDSYISSSYFLNVLSSDISDIGQSAVAGDVMEECEAHLDGETEKALAAYKSEAQKALVTEEELDMLKGHYHVVYGIDTPLTDDVLDALNSELGLHIYRGEDGNYYDLDFDVDNLCASSVASDHINFGRSDAHAKALLRESLEERISQWIPHDEVYVPEYENLTYYAVTDSGIKRTDIHDGTETQFIRRVKNGEGVSFYIENGKLYKSGKLNSLGIDLADASDYVGIYPFDVGEFKAGDTRTDCNIYVLIDESFSGNDVYSARNTFYNAFLRTDIGTVIITAIASILAAIVLAVCSVRLAGHTESGISVSAFDKIPVDLRFVVEGLCCFGLGMGIALCLSEYDSLLYYTGKSASYYHLFVTIACTVLCLCGIYLFVLDFACSLARNIKAGRPIFKNTVLYAITELFYKYVILSVKKGIDKLAYIVKSLIEKPKKLKKETIVISIPFVLINALAITAALISLAYSLWLCILIHIVLAVFDIAVIYKAVKFFKSLDAIIDAGQKRETPDLDTENLPESLKILTQSLESANADLQDAVAKAVRDERTKAELITNVSHDLKTPLTSIINYIDLLKKCDIQDETERKYIDIIDEKSTKLKRLIEDLIEASKVSSGNVTLNKTKLNLRELASQAIVEETESFKKCGLTIIFDDTAQQHTVIADGAKIYRVFENLLTNARKYSAPNTRVYARVYEDGDFGYFELKNISKESLNISVDELTERFVRGDKSRSQDGNGLGLSIAKELCILNGGELILAIDGDLFKATVKLPKSENAES